MTPTEIQLIVSGGALGVLAVMFGLLLRGELQTKPAVKATLDATSALIVELKEAHARELGEIVRDRDEWKALAKDAIHDVGELGEALNVRNKIDEGLRSSGILAQAQAAAQGQT
jgi:hypothetical protein